MNYSEILGKLRDGVNLSPEEIGFVARGIATEDMSDAQVGAFAMGVNWRGLETEQTTALTLSMRDTGDVMSWDVDGPIVDKHSTGGVGDSVSLALAPILASQGLYVPMISGRGLGHTGGTLDKLESMRGFSTGLSVEQMRTQLNQLGCVMAGQSAKLAPADKRLYAIRDITGTVPSVELITASILSKKLAAGLEHLILDVKCGLGAFMRTPEDAHALAQSLVDTANAAGCKTRAMITAMDIPLSPSAGNSLEVEDILALLEGKMDTRLYKVTRALCLAVMHSAGIEASEGDLDAIITSGRAMERFEEMVAAQGGPRGVIAIRNDMRDAPYIIDFKANFEGKFHGFDAYEIGMCVVILGGGRRQVDDILDYSVGFDNILEPCNVRRGDVLARIHARDEDSLNAVRMRLEGAILKTSMNDELILDRIE